MDDETSKLELLSILSEQEEVDAADVAEALDITYETAAMALLRAYRAGLVSRVGVRGTQVFRYALTDKGWERLQYLAGPSNSHRRGTPSPTTSEGGDLDMRTKKFHSGLYHCISCMYEVELTAETSLKCEDCRGRLSKGPLPEDEDDDQDDYDEDEEE